MTDEVRAEISASAHGDCGISITILGDFDHIPLNGQAIKIRLGSPGRRVAGLEPLEVIITGMIDLVDLKDGDAE